MNTLENLTLESYIKAKPKSSDINPTCRIRCNEKKRIIGAANRKAIIDSARIEEGLTTAQICDLSGFSRRAVVKHLTDAGWNRQPFGKTFKWTEDL